MERDFLSEVKRSIEHKNSKLFARTIKSFFKTYDKTNDLITNNDLIHPLWILEKQIGILMYELIQQKKYSMFSNFLHEKDIQRVNMTLLFSRIDKYVDEYIELLKDSEYCKIDNEAEEFLDYFFRIQAENIYTRICYHRKKRDEILRFEFIMMIEDEIIDYISGAILFSINAYVGDFAKKINRKKSRRNFLKPGDEAYKTNMHMVRRVVYEKITRYKAAKDYYYSLSKPKFGFNSVYNTLGNFIKTHKEDIKRDLSLTEDEYQKNFFSKNYTRV